VDAPIDRHMPRIHDQLQRFEAARARLRTTVGTLDKELAAIERRWREDEIDEAEMKVRSRRARRVAAAEIESAVRDARAALARGVELTQEMRAKRRGTNRAREHVRRLLDSGQVAGALLERAIELDDPETIVALRGELMWHGKSAKGDAIPEIAELVASCDRALARCSTGEERAEARAALELTEKSAAFDQLAEFAAKLSTEHMVPGKGLVSGATPRARMALGYAENAAGRASEG
jgi:hypothetical protein